MTDVMEAMDDAYKRAERKFSSIDKQLEWLGGFGAIGGLNTYEKGALQAYEELNAAKELKDKVGGASIFTIDKLEEDAKDIRFANVKRDVQKVITTRRKELESESTKVDRQTEKEYKSKIKDAKTPEEVDELVEKVGGLGIYKKTFNILKQEGLDRKKEIGVQVGKAKKDKEQDDARKREAQEKIDREAEKDAKNQKILDAAEEARVRQRQRYDEQKLAAQIAAEKDARADELAEAMKERRKELDRANEERQ